MWSSLANPILPIFAILALGFALNRLGLFDVAAAQSINRFVFYVATPALIFFIVSTASVAEFDWILLAVYLVAELAVYLATYSLMRFKLGLEKREALLLGMTSTFVNHVFFVLPIAERIYGPEVAKPIAGIILIDAIVLFCGTVLVMDLMQSTHRSALKVAAMLARNPFLIASLLGIAAWSFDPLIPAGLYTYADFAGAAAAPASLFALGIILASKPLRPIGMETWTVVLTKIIAHPLLVLALSALVVSSSGWEPIVLLVAAGPCGAMPFVIALQYGVKTDAIAKAILISTLLSLLSLSILTG